MQMCPVSEEEALRVIREKFRQGKQASLLVTGTSMVPFLRHKKDWVFLAPVTETPKKGQILLFRTGDRLLLHRLRKKKDGYYIMNGDGQQKLEIIQPEHVVAVVTTVVRRSGRTLSCKGRLFRLLSCLWWPTRPLRPGILSLAERLKRLYRGEKGVLS